MAENYFFEMRNDTAFQRKTPTIQAGVNDRLVRFLHQQSNSESCERLSSLFENSPFIVKGVRINLMLFIRYVLLYIMITMLNLTGKFLMPAKTIVFTGKTLYVRNFLGS